MIPIEIAELIRFYGTIVGTTGVSKEIVALCNENINRLLQHIQPEVTRATSGIISK